MSSRTVWRFPVAPNKNRQFITAPGRVKLLAIGPSREGLSIWVEVDQGEPETTTPYWILGTGWPIPEGAAYVGTDVGATGWVWHLYAEPTDDE